MYTIFTDGSCDINKAGANNIGGYAFVILNEHGVKVHEDVGRATRTTNNRMEMMAVIASLNKLKYTDEKILVQSDSTYVVKPFTEDWITGWKAKGFKKGQSDMPNKDLWELLWPLVGTNVTFKWVRGHNGNQWNEHCDKLAASVYEKNFKVIN